MLLGAKLELYLGVEGSGSDRLSYKWFKDGVLNVITTDPIFSIEQVTLSDQGSYMCSAFTDTDSILSSECLVTGKFGNTCIDVQNYILVVSTSGNYYHHHHEQSTNSLLSSEHHELHMQPYCKYCQLC